SSRSLVERLFPHGVCNAACGSPESVPSVLTLQLCQSFLVSRGQWQRSALYQHGNSLRIGCELAQNLEPLRRQCAGGKAHASDVAARPVQTGDKTVLDRIASGHEHNWYRRAPAGGVNRFTYICGFAAAGGGATAASTVNLTITNIVSGTMTFNFGANSDPSNDSAFRSIQPVLTSQRR